MSGVGRARARLSLAGPVALAPEVIDIDWEKCIVCQATLSSEKLECPALNPILSRRHAGYLSLAAKLTELRKFQYTLPCKFKIEKLDNGSGFDQTLSTNRAKWHKSCIGLFRNPVKFSALLSRLKDDQERVADADEELPAPAATGNIRQTRSAGVGPVQLKGNVCFLCKTEDLPENLHSCSTKEVHQNISDSAKKVRSNHLLELFFFKLKTIFFFLFLNLKRLGGRHRPAGSACNS